MRVAAVLGLVTSVLGVLLSLLFVLAYFLEGWLTATPVPPGWASLIVCVTVFSGLQLCVLGLLGEYLGRVLMTQNQAPQFIVREVHEPGSAATGASPLEAPAAAAPAAEAPAAEAPAAEVPAAEVPA